MLNCQKRSKVFRLPLSRMKRKHNQFHKHFFVCPEFLFFLRVKFSVVVPSRNCHKNSPFFCETSNDNFFISDSRIIEKKGETNIKHRHAWSFLAEFVMLNFSMEFPSSFKAEKFAVELKFVWNLWNQFVVRRKEDCFHSIRQYIKIIDGFSNFCLRHIRWDEPISRCIRRVNLKHDVVFNEAQN